MKKPTQFILKSIYFRHTVKVLETGVKPEADQIAAPNTDYYTVQFLVKNTDIPDKKKGVKIVPGDRLK
jgi:hypothetical protein